MAVSHHPRSLEHLDPITWRVVPLAPPRALRHCPRCGVDRPFASTARFRLNAQKQRLDVWLLYACAACEETWKLPLFSRTQVSAIDSDLFERMIRNDPDTARAFAFDVALLARAGARVEPAAQFRIEEVVGAASRAPRAGRGLRIRLDVPHPCSVRLDRLLAAGLALPRARLQRHAARGEIATDPPVARPLRRDVHHGQVIEVAARVFAPET
jgi:hypothetical protein